MGKKKNIYPAYNWLMIEPWKKCITLNIVSRVVSIYPTEFYGPFCAQYVYGMFPKGYFLGLWLIAPPSIPLKTSV